MFDIRDAEHGDLAQATSLLRAAHLNADDIDFRRGRFWIARAALGEIAGFVGVEHSREAVLLRSAVVAEPFRGQGLGARLAGHALAWARQNGFGMAYCFSTDAGSYWERFGFVNCPVDELVRALPDAAQVRRFEEMGWLPTEVAWRLSFAAGPNGHR